MADARANDSLPEFTLKALLCGLGFGALFGAANAYLGLKAGLTVSTSIPIAVLSVAVFRLFKSGTILEGNMAQTIGSASSSLASGTIFTIPALFMWGLAPPFLQVAFLAMFGGFLGILAMIPLRRLLIVQADAELPYPEGRACAEVLRATDGGASGGTWIFLGLAVGAAVKLALGGFHWLPEDVAWLVPTLENGKLDLKIAPALLAVGYIVGFRASTVMVSGSLITALVLYPLASAVFAAGSAAVADGGAALHISAGDVKSRFLLFVGAGAVACAGLYTVAKTAPTMSASLAAVFHGIRRGGAGTAGAAERTDRDLPGWMLLAGVLVLFLLLAFVPGIFAGDLPLLGRLAAASGVIVFGFLFVPVSSRLVGVVGVSSNPTSAMALITLVGTALVFAALGYAGVDARAAILTVGTIVCVAASKAGDISQDLKTGFLLRATPARQQLGQLIAAATACFAVAFVVVALGNGEGFGATGLPAPQATLMKTVVEAVLGESLPWNFLIMGAALAGVGILLGLPALPFALGIYLPPSTMIAIFLGGLVRWLVDRKRAAAAAGETKLDLGILCASGLVAGEGLAGVGVAGYALATGQGRYSPPAPAAFESLGSLLLFAGAALLLFRAGRARS